MKESVKRKTWYRSIVQTERGGLFNIQQGYPTISESKNLLYEDSVTKVYEEPAGFYGAGYYIIYTYSDDIVEALRMALNYYEDNKSIFKYLKPSIGKIGIDKGYTSYN